VSGVCERTIAYYVGFGKCTKSLRATFPSGFPFLAPFRPLHHFFAHFPPFLFPVIK
jgi:hypothetical protein